LPSAIAKKESNISLLLILTKASFFFWNPNSRACPAD
jgi:predicted membrane protein